MKQIVIVDTQLSYWSELVEADSISGQRIVSFNSWHAAKDLINSQDVILVIINTTLPDISGIELSWSLRQKPGAPEVLLITDAVSASDAEQSIRSGAWEYLLRPTNAKTLLPLINRVLKYSTNLKKEENQDNLDGALFDGIAGDSPKIKACLTLARQAAKSEANVLIPGETGTGKELLAWAIHKNSLRANNNFVVVDCAALPETLVESTLLGYERGAFTGADKAQDGLIKQADGGTLFLDEVGELPLSTQKSFLRVLEERQFRRVGGREEIASDFRLLSASNKNLAFLVNEGKFREDLLFRLRSFTIELPPLRERKEDVKNIIHFHLPRLCSRIGNKTKNISDEYYDALEGYEWPGNVRELINALDRSIVAARNETTIYPQHLPTYLRVYLARERATQLESHKMRNERHTTDPLQSLQDARNIAVSKAEKEYLRELIHEAQGDITIACRVSGVSRSRLYALLKKYNISAS